MPSTVTDDSVIVVYLASQHSIQGEIISSKVVTKPARPDTNPVRDTEQAPPGATGFYYLPYSQFRDADYRDLHTPPVENTTIYKIRD